MSGLTDQQQRLLKPYFTNLDQPVFVLKNLPEVVKGALFSRYSRTTKSLREVLLTEFLENPELGFGQANDAAEDRFVQTEKAEAFYDRVLVGYGDDSVAELAGVHIAIEDVSNIATKVLQDARIGLSPLEKSSRYVTFNDQVDGQYRYYRDPEILESKHQELYLATNDLLFDTYSKLIEPMLKWVRAQFPKQADETDRAYQSATKAKALDCLRGLLPAATLTNMGIYGNGRAFEYLLSKLYAHPMKEMRDIAAAMHRELAKVIPSFVKRANDKKYGQATIDYQQKARGVLETFAGRKLDRSMAESEEQVRLIEYDRDAEERVLAGMLYPYSTHSFYQVREVVKKLDDKDKEKLLKEYLVTRDNRRHKPGRGLEYTDYTFDILANYGAYRDLQRHRMLTQQRQNLSVYHGYDIPWQIIEAGFEKPYREAMEKAADAYEQMTDDFPHQAQYVVPFAYKIRWSMRMNLRELYHLVELRSTPQGHPDYRRVAQSMYQNVQEVHPILVEYMKFVDLSETDELERRSSEKKIDEKLASLQKKK